MENQVIERLNSIFIVQGLTQDALSSDVQLLDELALDSFELVQLVMAINQTFSIEVQSHEIIPENFETLATLAQLINQKLV